MTGGRAATPAAWGELPDLSGPGIEWTRLDDPPGAMAVTRNGEPVAEFEWERAARSCRITVPGVGMWRATVAGRLSWRIELRDVDATHPTLRFAGNAFRGAAELADGRRYTFTNWVRWMLRPRVEFTNPEGKRVLWFEALVGWKKFATAVRISDDPADLGAPWPLLMLFGTLMLQWPRSLTVWLTGPWTPTALHRKALHDWQQTPISPPRNASEE